MHTIKKENTLKKEMLRHFSTIEYSDNGYLFAVADSFDAMTSKESIIQQKQ